MRIKHTAAIRSRWGATEKNWRQPRFAGGKPSLRAQASPLQPALALLAHGDLLQWIRSRPLAQPYGPSPFGRIPFAFSQKAQVTRPAGRVDELGSFGDERLHTLCSALTS